MDSTQVEADSWKIEILNLLKDKIFLGKFTERRYVEPLTTYR